MGERYGKSAVIFDEPDCFVQVRLGSCHGCHGGAFCRDGKGSLPADALTGSGHDCDFSL